MSEFFKAEDFSTHPEMIWSGQITADTANCILKERATVVYGRPDIEVAWMKEKHIIDTHRGLLLNIEPLEEKAVKITRKDLERALEKQYNLSVYAVGGLDRFCKELGLD